jgi:DNA-binding NarL/FixJ family response regulator
MTTTTKTTEICVVEDHEEIRSGIVFIINTYPGFHCTSYRNGEEALKGFKRSVPDVILMDINLPGMDGIECTRLIKEMHPAALIMMCTVFEDSPKIFNALKAGASGYILKRTAGETLIDAIKELLNGGAPMSSDIARKVVHSFRESDATLPTADNGLTNKESMILNLLAGGYGNKEMAEKLCVSVNTIRTHIYHIYEKLHVHNRVEALNKIKKATRRG